MAPLQRGVCLAGRPFGLLAENQELGLGSPVGLVKGDVVDQETSAGVAKQFIPAGLIEAPSTLQFQSARGNAAAALISFLRF